MARCRVCGAQATVHLRSHNLPLCEKDFIEFFKKRVEKAIRRWKMFTKKEKVVIGVSGGKDSMALWTVLVELGYNVTAVHINLGIGEFSRQSLEAVEKHAQNLSSKPVIVNVEDYLGATIPEAAKRLKKPACAVCGVVKRYILNMAVAEADVIVTGHHLDDEASALLGNLLHWQFSYLSKRAPVLPAVGTLKKRAKPLVLVSELEVNYFVKIKNINHTTGKCPLSIGATSHFYKKLIEEIESDMPGTRLRFYKTFIEEVFPLFSQKYYQPVLKPCERCGYMTTEKVCSFCKMKERLQKS